MGTTDHEAELDEILTLQLGVAWAGEAADADERRLGWWATDMRTEFGGLALLETLAPRTFRWATFEVARQAAKRVDAQHRHTDAGADRILSLFHLGHPLDEQLEDRLASHKRSERPPEDTLPRLAALPSTWDANAFAHWLGDEAAPPHRAEPAGLRITTPPPENGLARARALAALLSALPDAYPCAHYRDGTTR